jgi:hypothetical protein
MAMISKDYKLIAKEIEYIFSKGLTISKDDMCLIVANKIISESSLSANLRHLKDYVCVCWNRQEKCYYGANMEA